MPHRRADPRRSISLRLRGPINTTGPVLVQSQQQTGCQFLPQQHVQYSQSAISPKPDRRQVGGPSSRTSFSCTSIMRRTGKSSRPPKPHGPDTQRPQRHLHRKQRHQVNLLSLMSVQQNSVMQGFLAKVPTTYNNFNLGDSSAALLRNTAATSQRARQPHARQRHRQAGYNLSTKNEPERDVHFQSRPPGPAGPGQHVRYGSQRHQ